MSDKKRSPVMGKLINPALRSGFQEGSTSPTTPLEFKVRSPRGMIKRDMSGVGLAITLALKKYNVMRSDPIPLSRSRNVGDLEMGVEASSVEEENKIVTCHKLNKSFTKVYHGEHVTEINEQSCIFNISPARFGDDDMKVCQPSDFLSSCSLCNKRLHGKDIYMFRGEKAFCSPECRSRQITMDESAEKYCSSRASGTRCQTFATVILAI